MGKNGLDNINFEAYKAGVQEAKDIVDSAIQADKDIVSQITSEYNEDDDVTLIYFPKKVLPIKIYLEGFEYLFFDYDNGILVDSNGDEQGLVEGADSYSVFISISGEIDISGLDEIYYLNVSNVIDTSEAGNWYKILNPSDGGTKLYKHTINMSSSGDVIYIVSIRSTPYTSINLISGDTNTINFNSSCFGIRLAQPANMFTCYRIKQTSPSSSDTYFFKCTIALDGSLTETQLSTPSNFDTVTEL